MVENVSKEYYRTKSPHVLINRKWFNRIRNNTVMLKNATESYNNSRRLIHYEVDRLGDNIKCIRKGNKWILNPSNTKYNMIIFAIRLADLWTVKKLQFHTVIGHMIGEYDLKNKKNQCYVLLSVIQINKEVQKSDPIIYDKDLSLMRRFFINQIAVKKGSNYHFNTSGIIYGLGYGPKCNRNEFGHSVCKYANSKYLDYIFHSVFFFENLYIFLNDIFCSSDIEKNKLQQMKIND